jgi:hypothetical protein
MLVQSERFADDPADSIAFDTTARGTNRNGKTETRPTLVVPERSHTKESIAKPSPASVGRIKVRLPTQTPLGGKSKPCWGRAVASQAGIVLLTGAPQPGIPQSSVRSWVHRMRRTGGHGCDACVARVAREGQPWAVSRHSLRKWTRWACAKQGLRSAMPRSPKRPRSCERRSPRSPRKCAAACHAGGNTAGRGRHVIAGTQPSPRSEMHGCTVRRVGAGARAEMHGAQPERVAARNKRRGFCHALRDELSAALGATACQYSTAVLSSHTCTEPVRARTPHFARLIGALHSMDSVDGPWVPKRAARLSR